MCSPARVPLSLVGERQPFRVAPVQVIEPIQSRCAILRFVRLSDAELLERLRYVCQQEQVCTVCSEHLLMPRHTAQGPVFSCKCKAGARVPLAVRPQMLEDCSPTAVSMSVTCRASAATPRRAGRVCAGGPGSGRLHSRRRHAAGAQRSAGMRSLERRPSCAPPLNCAAVCCHSAPKPRQC